MCGTLDPLPCSSDKLSSSLSQLSHHYGGGHGHQDSPLAASSAAVAGAGGLSFHEQVKADAAAAVGSVGSVNVVGTGGIRLHLLTGGGGGARNKQQQQATQQQQPVVMPPQV